MGNPARYPEIEQLLGSAFPGLKPGQYSITSPADPAYNCGAWAAGTQSRFWRPTREPDYFWPHGVPMDESLPAFKAAFAIEGYLECSTEAFEDAIEKVAIFVDANGVPSHAARQLPNARWTSKLGRSVDIEHDLRAVEGIEYGTVAAVLARPVRRP